MGVAPIAKASHNPVGVLTMTFRTQDEVIGIH